MNRSTDCSWNQENDLSKMFILLGQTALLYVKVLLIPESFKHSVKHKTNKKVTRSKFKIERQMSQIVGVAP